MADGSPDNTLPIRCPSCGQRFKVGPDLMGRMVECGTCEHRFRVSETVQVRSKKYYPGEKDSHLDRFSRVPKAGLEPMTNGPQPLPYGFNFPQQAPQHPGPTSPLRVICGLLAGLVVIIAVVLLAFGSSPGGVLDGADLTKRLALAVFGAVLAGVLIFIANSNAKGKASIGALLVAALLISMPFLVKAHVASGDGGSLPTDVNSDPIATPAVAPEDKLADLKKEMGYSETIEGQILHSTNAPGKGAAGIWLRDLREFHKAQVGNYIIRTTNADPTSHMYPRGPDYFMVVTGVTEDLGELVKVCERFGEVKRVLPEVRVIEVLIRNDAFEEGSLDKLSDPKNPSFYDLNRRELESIDLERCRNAVRRLTGVPPSSYRPDIVHRLQQLLKEGTSEMQGEIALALDTWAQDGDGSVAAVHAAAEKIRSQKFEMPESMIAFLAKRKDVEAVPMVEDLWVLDSTKWETPYGDLGPAAEPSLLKRFPDASPTLRMSAARILARAGTAKSIPVLEAARPTATGELRTLIDTAIASIRSRQ